MDTDPQIIPAQYGHAEHTFTGDRAGIDAAYAFVRRALGEAPGAECVGDVLLILAGNAVRHSDSRRGGTFLVQVTSQRGHWKLRIDDDGHASDHPHLIASERGEPLHGLAALNDAGVHWRLPGPGAILAEINHPLPDETPADLSVPAKRAVASVA